MVVVSNYFLFFVLSLESVFFGTLLLICNLSSLSSVYDRYQLQKHLREMDEKKISTYNLTDFRILMNVRNVILGGRRHFWQDSDKY